MANLLAFVPENGFHKCECNVLDDFYREIECDTIDIATRFVNGKFYDIYVDDEGLLKESPQVSAIDGNGNPMLVGNLIFANHDGRGGLEDLSEDDIKRIMSSCLIVQNMATKKFHYAIELEYS